MQTSSSPSRVLDPLKDGTGRGQLRRTRTSPTRVALLSTWHPEPIDNGRKQRTRQMIASLAEEHEVVLISLLPPREVAAGNLPRIPGVWQQWELPLPEFAPRSLPALIAGLHPMPRSVVATWQQDTAMRLAHILREAHVELAIGTDLRTLRYLNALDADMRTLLDEPDVSPYTSEASALESGLDRLRAFSRHRKYRRLLHRAAHRLDAAVVASSQEAQAYRGLSGSARVVVIENGVSAVPDAPWRAPDTAQLLYPGSLTYGPNAEAVAFFARAILPRIEQEHPEARLLVTGTAPSTLPPGTEHARVTVTGRLDEDAFAATFRHSRACVVPLLSGTGTRIKVLEAMALGIPVVSTSKGAEGLDVIAGEEILIADTPAEFAAATGRLLRDAAFAEAIGARGRERIRRDYTWDSRGQQLRDLVRACLAAPPRERA